ncbi:MULTISPECIES: DNA polymerase domain-containing protein [Anaerolinea]|uniref:DNA polymerase domain-containing protein n=1 Tax=Anaerolinea TaxID=233189 RepID=UPI002627631A|nr:DNA polymerase domain-containing protein [Anaerolinea thermophila]
MKVECLGWLMDVYLRPDGTPMLWLIDQTGKRWLLRMHLPVTFYVTGGRADLRQAWRYLSSRSVSCERQDRKDLFRGQCPVMAVTLPDPASAQAVYHDLRRNFPLLDYYDADLPLGVRLAGHTGVHLLGQCRFTTDGEQILMLSPLDSPWDLDPSAPSLRILEVELPDDPHLSPPAWLDLRFQTFRYRLSLEPLRAFGANLRALLSRFDPDVILTDYGDTWLFPFLQKVFPEFNLNRDPGMAVAVRPARTLFAYGQVLYRGEQAFLFGRWHIDRRNAALFGEIGLEGAMELARVTQLGVQETARKSPGAGITAMQMLTALQEGVLIPAVKQQAESPRTLSDLIRADRGGMIYQPLVGVYRHVAEIDFASMYPSIMVQANISPETLAHPDAPPGLIPRTLTPLLRKRLALKQRLQTLDPRDERIAGLKARQSALKWLLVVCFGYLGYKNARFGKVESHEKVTALSRELLLQAKELAEEQGFTVLHMYVDSLFVHREGGLCREDVAPLLEAIQARTSIGVTLEGIYRWLVFLPSRQDGRTPVPNRYFGVFEDGTLKVRGLALRRHDTCAFAASVQGEILRILAQAEDPRERVADARVLVQRELQRLSRGQIPPAVLKVAVKLSRAPESFRKPGPAAQAARLLAERGVAVRAGMRLHFWFTRQGVSVDMPAPSMVDVDRYARLVQRAAEEILQPLESPPPVPFQPRLLFVPLPVHPLAPIPEGQ